MIGADTPGPADRGGAAPPGSADRASALGAQPRVCDACLRRTALIAALAGPLDVERKRREGRLGAVLALGEEELLALDESGDAAARYTAFDPIGARARIAAAGLVASCRCTRYCPAAHALLADLTDPPAVLHTTDAVALEQAASTPAVAIVGARRASAYGLEVARALGRGLAEVGVPVVSGLALGIDSAAHAGALEGGGLTVAVLAGGADIPYPRSSARLYERIRANGAVVSEFPPGFLAHRWCWPARNRIIAALAQLVIVVEGAERSGSLITADFAAQLGRGVAAVPGPVTARLSTGVNALIRTGAAPVRHVQDVLDEVFGAGAHPPAPDPLAKLEPPLRRLLDALEAGRSTPAALVRRPDELGAVMQGLAELEMRGLIRRESGGRYLRTMR